MSGYGPLSGGQSAALTDEVMRVAGANTDRFFIQANGWDETREWGAPDMTTEGQFDKIWAKPVMRGLQMIQPDGYDWTRSTTGSTSATRRTPRSTCPASGRPPARRPSSTTTPRRGSASSNRVEAFADRTC